MHIKLGFLFIAGLLMGTISAGYAAKKETGFLNRIVTVGKNLYRYQVYVPQDWNGNKKWPIILFLHGAGERGEDGLAQTQVGIATAIRLHADRFPCIVVMPQCRKALRWSQSDMEAQALAALKNAIKEFKGDPDRTYLTGLSMGGYGTWSLAYKYPTTFAALAPICGGVKPIGKAPADPGNPFADPNIDPYAALAKKIGKTPVWIFHGAADNVVPVTESQKISEALTTAGGNVKYTEYPGVGHNSWDRAYAESELMPWLLSQHRSR
jgi:predicted peptidase